MTNIKKYIIRDASKDDMHAVLDLIKELAIFENEPNAVIIDAEYLKAEGFKEKPSFKIFVAEMNNKIIGMTLFYPRFSTWKGVSIHLEDLIVKKEYRNLGIGKALYKHFLEYANSKKVKRVEWAVLDWNINAINFYKKSGATVFDDWKIVQMNEQQLSKFINKK